MEQSKTTDASGGGELSVLRQAARAGRLRVRRNERLSDADPDAGMVWPIEVELPCINGLSCWFSLGSVYAPDAAAQGYTDGALNDDLAQAFAHYIVAALASAPPAPTPEAGSDLAGQGEPVAWVFEWMSRGGWREGISRTNPGSLGTRNIEPLFKCAAHAPSRPADREEIAEAAFIQYFLHNATGPEDDWDAATIAWSKERYPDDRRLAYAIADAVILALRDAPRDGGDGWKFVPAKMTDAMRDAAARVNAKTWSDLPAIYAAAIAAAPSPNAGDGTQDKRGGGR